MSRTAQTSPDAGLILAGLAGSSASRGSDHMDTNTLIMIILVVLLLGGGGVFYRRRRA